VVRGAAIQGSAMDDRQVARHATVEAQGQHLLRMMSDIAGSDIEETGQQDRPKCIEIADDRSRTIGRTRDPIELAPVQDLPVRQMHIGNRHVTGLQDLRKPGWKPARHFRRRQLERMSGPGCLRTPRGQAVAFARPGLGIKSPSHPVCKPADRARYFLHQKQVRRFLFNDGGDIIDSRTNAVQQIPAYDFQGKPPIRISLEIGQKQPSAGIAELGGKRTPIKFA